MIVSIKFCTPSRDHKQNSHGQVVLADHSFTKRDLSHLIIGSLLGRSTNTALKMTLTWTVV